MEKNIIIKKDYIFNALLIALDRLKNKAIVNSIRNNNVIYK